ncbi:hypothetical protein VTN96DRAFT_7399 [Rasamsonia emersonii]
MMDLIPTQFGGLPVDVATDKMTPCIETDEITPSTKPAEPADPVVRSGAQGPSKGSPQVELYPGSRLTVRGLLTTQASAGVLVDTGNGEVALTTVSHLPLLHQRCTRKGIKAFSLKLDRPKTAVGLTVYSDNNESPVAHVNRIFDDEAHTKDYPTGYTFGLAFLKPLVPIVMHLGQPPNKRRFRPKASPLPFNELLRLMSPSMGSDVAVEGRALPSGFGTAVGEAFVKANIRFCNNLADREKKSTSNAEKQLSRCTLWRMAGPHRSLGTTSSSPVEVVSTGEILGFQCWEWAKRRGIPPVWARDTYDLTRDDKTLAMRYPFYGIYDLPDEVERMSIVEQS